MNNDKGGFISGIFNYCDRWCERCPLTARCRVFAMEYAGPSPRNMRDDGFWEHLQDIFAQTAEMVRQSAQEMGISLDDPDAEDPGPSPWDDLEHDDILQTARCYGTDLRLFAAGFFFAARMLAGLTKGTSMNDVMQLCDVVRETGFAGGESELTIVLGELLRKAPREGNSEPWAV
jgi:hypothetical protein